MHVRQSHITETNSRKKVPLLNKGQVFEPLWNQDGHTHHFVVDFVEVNFADFVNDAFTFKRYKCEPCAHNRKQRDQPWTTSTVMKFHITQQVFNSHHDNQVRRG